MVEELGYTMDEFIGMVKDNKINYLRQNMIDVELHGLIVAEYIDRIFSETSVKKISFTLKDGLNPEYGNHNKSIPFLKPWKDHLVLEAHNELLDTDDTAEIRQIITCIHEHGMTASAGAWGNSTHGEALAEQLLSDCNADEITMHRPYPHRPSFVYWIDEKIKVLQPGKRISWDEILPEPIPGGIPVAELESYIRLAKEKGITSVAIYGNCKDHIGLMGRLCREFNS